MWHERIYHGSTWINLTVHSSTWLYFPLLDSIRLYYTLQCDYLTLLDSTTLHHASALSNKYSVPMVLRPSICVMATLLAMSLCTIIVALEMYIITYIDKISTGRTSAERWPNQGTRHGNSGEGCSNKQATERATSIKSKFEIFYCKNRKDQLIIWLLGWQGKAAYRDRC